MTEFFRAAFFVYSQHLFSLHPLPGEANKNAGKLSMIGAQAGYFIMIIITIIIQMHKYKLWDYIYLCSEYDGSLLPEYTTQSLTIPRLPSYSKKRSHDIQYLL